MVTIRPPKTIVKPTALGPVANTDTKLLIYGLFQKGRVLAQDGVVRMLSKDYQRLLETHGLTASMSRWGNCYDNARSGQNTRTLNGSAVCTLRLGALLSFYHREAA